MTKSKNPNETDIESSLIWIIIIAALILFISSSGRHALFQSTAFDLGIFDNAIYLISQGKEPIISFRGLHILGDHAAWILYFLAIPYKIYPSVYWLFFIQALSLAIGVLPVWYLARQADLSQAQGYSLAIAYLFYPVVFNANLFDFHPEVIAIPLILGSVWAARAKKLWWFVTAIIFILGCKAVLALMVMAIGMWLIVREKRIIYGAIAIFAGIVWFIIATQLIIPTFSGEEAAAVGRYDFLGDSVQEIARNLIFKPGLVLSKIFTLANLEYLLLLLIPWCWGLSWKNLHPLFGATPLLLLNLLTNYQLQKDLIHQYSLPILPFLVLAAIATLQSKNGWLQSRKAIALWSLITWLALAKFGYFGSKYLQSMDTRMATKTAISKIATKASVLAPATVVPHLSHRPEIEAIDNSIPEPDLDRFQYVIINSRHLGINVSPELIDNLLLRLEQSPYFQLDFRQDDVFLFSKISHS
ncbi:DUF2079 domain-containing protein [Waterburya agarophytonicola K14]|uniref:DUF2079 domain-containing protein n=1 Tax=Waterburya agarophytonicola KI4 TaxID=2874699 RepID=A0A964BTQ9_9CYAN|nr:DUF2079 domain-containing protein [Waterburya agarophytonicola]MCC0178358.1 DUF2079 domain-containing protein [Waterburya agarophytonicola KI4]